MASVELSEVEALFVRNADAIKGFLFALTADPHAADDLMQEVYLVVREKAAEFAPGSNFLAWVRTIARFKVMHHFRNRGRRPLIDPANAEALAAVDEALGVDGADEWAEHRNALARCLERIGSAPRQLLDLRFAEDLSPTGMAERLGRSANGVSVALSRTLTALRDCVGRLAGGTS